MFVCVLSRYYLSPSVEIWFIISVMFMYPYLPALIDPP